MQTQLYDAIFWLKQLTALAAGVAFGLLPLTGGTAAFA